MPAEMTTPLKDGGGNFKHYNTVAPKEEKVFPLLNNKGKTAIVTGTLQDLLVQRNWPYTEAIRCWCWDWSRGRPGFG